MEQGLPSFRIKYTKDLQAGEYVRIAWLKDIMEMQDALCEFLVSFSKFVNGDHIHLSLIRKAFLIVHRRVYLNYGDTVRQIFFFC